MIVPKSAKVEKAASSDQARPVLTCLHVREGAEPGTGTLEATDSYMLVRVPVTLEDGDVAGLIPASALAEARKGTDRMSSDVRISVNGDVAYTTKDGAEVHAARPEGKFPDAAQLFPAETTTFEIGLSPKLLLALAEAIGSPDMVRIAFSRTRDGSDTPDPLRPMVVRPMRGDTLDADGILMPIRIG